MSPTNQLCTYKNKGGSQRCRNPKSIFIEIFQSLTRWARRNWTKFYVRTLSSQTAKTPILMQFYILWGWSQSAIRSCRHLISEMSITLGVLLTKIIVLLQAKDARSLILMMSHSWMVLPTKRKSSGPHRVQIRVHANGFFAQPASLRQSLPFCWQPL